MEKVSESPEVSGTEEEKNNYKIKVICSNCKVDMGEKEGGQSEGLISHSICPKCLKELYPDFAGK